MSEGPRLLNVEILVPAPRAHHPPLLYAKVKFVVPSRHPRVDRTRLSATPGLDVDLLDNAAAIRRCRLRARVLVDEIAIVAELIRFRVVDFIPFYDNLQEVFLSLHEITRPMHVLLHASCSHEVRAVDGGDDAYDEGEEGCDAGGGCHDVV